MKLLTKQLKQFNSIAGGMKQNGILPILSYLRFKDGTITKNNLESFVTMEADFEGSVLIDEKILMSFVEYTNAEEINVEVDGTRVILSCGKEKYRSPTDDVNNFPENAVPDGEEIEISQDVLRAVKVASNFTMDRDNMPYTSCVFIGNGLVGAITGYIAYVEKIGEGLPNIILERQAFTTIRNFNSVFFSENDSYQFFTNGSFKFGFIKKDTKFINLEPFTKVPKEKPVTMDKTELQNFCDMVVSTSAGRIIITKIKEDKVSMVDSDFGNDSEKILPASLPDFSFNPVFMSKLLKSLPDDELNFIKEGNKFFVTGESGFVSIIMELEG